MIRDATPEDAAAIARVHVAAWAETYAGLVPPKALARWTVAQRTERWRGILSGGPPNIHQTGVAVLDLGGTVAGFASWGEQQDDALRDLGLTGEVSAIYLLRSVQGRGHGRTLMAHAARALGERGHGGAALWVFSANLPARRFYDRLGGVALAEKPFEMEGATLPETAYAWTSLGTLASVSSPGVGSSQ